MPPYLSPRSLERLKRHATYPVEVDTGSYYPCGQRDIDDYQAYALQWDGIHEDVETMALEATKRLSDYPGPGTTASLYRLRDAATDPDWGPDTIIKAFHDIDNAFFGRWLRGRVIVKWTTQRDLSKKRNIPHDFILGCTQSKTPGRATIYMNADAVFIHGLSHTKRQMWCTTMHEAVVCITRTLMEVSILLNCRTACLHHCHYRCEPR